MISQPDVERVKYPEEFGYLLYLQIDYEIYNNVLHRFGVCAYMGADKQKIGDRKMCGAGLFSKRISAYSRFNANDYRRAIRLSCNFSD